jgi:hypothetical protein
VGHYTVAGLVVGEGEDGVGSAANFKGGGFLEIFAFEKELSAGGFVEVLGGEDGGAVNLRGDASEGGADVVEGGDLGCGWGGVGDGIFLFDFLHSRSIYRIRGDCPIFMSMRCL